MMSLQRKNVRTGVRSTLVLTFVAMFNLVVQPCAMAMDMDMDPDHPCPHCPESLHEAPAAEPASTSTVAADCNSADVFSLDARTTQLGAKDLADDVPVYAIDLFSPWVPEVAAGQYEPRLQSGAFSGDPPLNVLYCVYLK